MSKTSESGAVFRVISSSGEIEFSAPVGASLGVWGKFNVYALDFLVGQPGSYTIEVHGPASANSPKFPIGMPERLYSAALANALNFYQNERDGSGFIKTPLRNASGHLNDKHAPAFASRHFDANDRILNDLKPTGISVDALGGWWDAGDYLKFVQTHSYTVALMLIGARDFPRQMGPGGTTDFINEVKFGMRWLQKMWDDQNQTLYYQVGIGTDFLDDASVLSDHDLWRLPQVDDTLG